MALTPKQQAFCREYLIDLNATQAYIRAGYRARGHAAEVNASKLLRNTEVQAGVADAMRSRNQRTEITADWVLNQLRKEATDDSEEASHAARVAALKVIAQHLGMLKDNAPSVNVNLSLHGSNDLSDAELEQRIAQLETRISGPPRAAGGSPSQN